MSATTATVEDGGAVDIEPDPIPAGTARPGKFKAGDLVTVVGEHGSGEVLEVVDGTVKVRLTHRSNGAASEIFVPPQAVVLVRKGATRSSLRLCTFSEICAIPTASVLVKDLLRLGDSACLYGMPAAGKSFLAVDIGLCIATGTDWHGRRVAQGRVLYISGEGIRGLRKRIRAWLADRDPSLATLVEENLSIVPCAVDMLGEDLDTLLEQIRDTKFQAHLVVIDTVARCMPGADENTAQAMGLFVAGCDAVKEAVGGATVLAIHHCGRDGEQERGSTALRGAFDVMLKAKAEQHEGAKSVELSGNKSKDDEDFPVTSFRLDVVQVGIEEDGEPETSCRLLPDTSVAESAPASFSDLSAAGLKICRALRDYFFEKGATQQQLKATGIKSATFYRHIKAVHKAGYVERAEKGSSVRYCLTAKFDEPGLSPLSQHSQSPVRAESHADHSQLSPLSHPVGVREVRDERAEAGTQAGRTAGASRG